MPTITLKILILHLINLIQNLCKRIYVQGHFDNLIFSVRGTADNDCEVGSFVEGDKYKNDLVPTDCSSAQINGRFCFRQLCQCNENHRQVTNDTDLWNCEIAITTQNFTVSIEDPIVFK